MLYMTLQEIAQVCAPAHTFSSEEEALTLAVGGVTDNRKVEPGNLFFAIKGERVDGHRFAQQAIDAGASAVIAERPLPEVTGPVIVVESTTQALSRIAAAYRQRFTIPVVGITGSVGKTSTKEMIASILSQKYSVLRTDGNFNNEIGMPLTLLRVREEHEVAVVEMGINHFGEMDRMSQVARPDLFVITNIGECHLEFLGDRDGVLRAKTEGFAYMKPGTPVVLNGEDDKLITLREDPRIRPVFYRVTQETGRGQQLQSADGVGALGPEQLFGQTGGPAMVQDFSAGGTISCESENGLSCADLTNIYMEGMLYTLADEAKNQTRQNGPEEDARGVRKPDMVDVSGPRKGPECVVYADALRPLGEDGTEFTLHAGAEVRRVHLGVPGIHMVRNALSGTCIAREMGLSMDQIVRGIEEMRTISGRSNFLHVNGITVIDDCYNANPTSTKASLDMLAGCGGRRIAVLGDMGELGVDEVRMHRQVGEYAASLGLEAAFFCGPLSQAAAEGMLEHCTGAPRQTPGGAGDVRTPDRAWAAAQDTASLTAGTAFPSRIPGMEAGTGFPSWMQSTASALPVIRWFAGKEDLIPELVSYVRPGDTVLVKASHFMGFDEIVKSLQA